MGLGLCSNCQRHVFHNSRVCPFCRSPLVGFGEASDADMGPGAATVYGPPVPAADQGPTTQAEFSQAAKDCAARGGTMSRGRCEMKSGPEGTPPLLDCAARGGKMLGNRCETSSAPPGDVNNPTCYSGTVLVLGKTRDDWLRWSTWERITYNGHGVADVGGWSSNKVYLQALAMQGIVAGPPPATSPCRPTVMTYFEDPKHPVRATVAGAAFGLSLGASVQAIRGQPAMPIGIGAGVGLVIGALAGAAWHKLANFSMRY